MTADRPTLAYLAPSDPARPQPGRANDEEADRSEEAVLTAYLFHLAARGHRVLRHRVVTEPALASSDLYDATAGELVMACRRFHQALVTASGVIADCARLFPPGRCALLFTAEPGPASLELLSHHGIVAIWPAGRSFERANPGAAGERG
ncbi:hypothetical protein [Kitasatospora sp. NPDC088783]|uniref:hypothetical protein n=1 Tax=Kitasatospora sp. NPDC088783 TaxID=3364077 RepID=UPI0037F89F44